MEARERFDPRQRLYKTEAVVLRRSDFGEADRLLTLYTPNRGKLRAIAKGIRRPTSRKAGHLELFCHSRVLIAKGRNLDIITQAEAIDYHLALREDLERLARAYCLAELVDRLTPEEGEENPPLFVTFLEALKRLGEGKAPALTLCHYELRVLECAGFGVQLFRCTACGREIRPEANFFGAAAGGVLCPECGEGRGDAREISLPALKALRYLSREGIAASQRLRLEKAVAQEIQGLLQGHILHTLERKLRSAEFLSQVGA